LYGGVLGLPLIEQTSYACVFRSANAASRVATAAEVVPAPYTVLGWNVTDVEVSARELAARGVSPLRDDGLDHDELGIWCSPSGARVLWFGDPDGDVLSITES
jgi:hypothetical protein